MNDGLIYKCPEHRVRTKSEEQTLMTGWTPMSMKMGSKDIFEINLAS
jgi:hypothetical protein